MSRPRYKRAAGEHAAEEPEVPIVLPHVVMQVAGDGTVGAALVDDLVRPTVLLAARRTEPSRHRRATTRHRRWCGFSPTCCGGCKIT